MTRDEIQDVYGNFQVNTDAAISSANINKELKDLLNELMKQTFYAIHSLCEDAAED